MTDGPEGRAGGDRTGPGPTTRRSLLALAPGVLASIAGCGWPDAGSNPTDPTPDPTPPPSPTPTGPLDAFDPVLDAVEDVGCDPTGETPCDAAIESNVSDGVAIRFPEGSYRFERGHGFRGVGRLGLVGDGDVSFVPPAGFNDKLIEISGDRALFSGIDIDIRERNTTAGLRFITNEGFHVEDVAFRGRGIHEDSAVANAMALAVTNPAGRGTVRNVVATQGSAIGHYKNGNGRVGIWVGRRHRGRVSISDCRLEEFGNNGIYASRAPGATEVVGGEFRNNNISSVRLGGQGSFVSGATIEIDLDRYGGPHTRTEDQYNTRAIVIERGPHASAGRVLVEDCDVRFRRIDRSQGLLVVWATGAGPRIERSRFRTAADGPVAIRAQSPVDRIDPSERSLEIRDATIAGGGSGMVLRDRPGSSIVDTSINQTGTDRDGVSLVRSDPIAIDGSTIAATRYSLFVAEPRLVDDRCLAVLVNGTRLERTAPPPADASSVERPDAPGGDCIGPAILDGTEDAAGIAIMDVSAETISWVPLSDLDGDRY